MLGVAIYQLCETKLELTSPNAVRTSRLPLATPNKPLSRLPVFRLDG